MNETDKELTISSEDMNTLILILRTILRRDPSITEIAEILKLIGSFK
ncbi:MAG: hypothetical protein OXN27_25690 [Candidatus Poribacteria bacterium]|nr:hypothetical protein [Candidatus Poribacteria bacterium]